MEWECIISKFLSFIKKALDGVAIDLGGSQYTNFI